MSGSQSCRVAELVEAPSRIEVAAGTELVVTWEGQAPASVTASVLRAACQCADCRSDAGLARTGGVLRRSDEIRITGARLVGAYAVSLDFAPDNHTTGIFSYELLHRLAVSATD